LLEIGYARACRLVVVTAEQFFEMVPGKQGNAALLD
jgi:hypothetical protein